MLGPPQSLPAARLPRPRLEISHLHSDINHLARQTWRRISSPLRDSKVCFVFPARREKHAHDPCTELQMQYTTYKNNLQQLAQKIGDVEQEAEEHKYVTGSVLP